MMRTLAAALLCFAVSLRASESPAPEDLRAQQLAADPRYKAAVAAFERDFDRFVNEIVTLTQIPAPPFGEALRAQAYAKLLKGAGLENVGIDAEGNVTGLWRG